MKANINCCGNKELILDDKGFNGVDRYTLTLLGNVLQYQCIDCGFLAQITKPIETPQLEQEHVPVGGFIEKVN